MASQDDGWGGGEDGSSLFEGMVLFAPEPAAAEDSVPTPAPVPELTSAARPDADAASSAPPPLDEDLFSDLTLLAPQEPLSLEQPPPPPQGEDRSHAALAPAPPAAAAELSRQPSSSSLRKKKRAVRIGYGRLPQPAPPSPPASAAAAAISASSISFLDASPHAAVTRILDQLPDRQVDVYANGYEAHAEAVAVDTSSPRVEAVATEDDGGGKEDEDAAVVALGSRRGWLSSDPKSPASSTPSSRLLLPWLPRGGFWR